MGRPAGAPAADRQGNGGAAGSGLLGRAFLALCLVSFLNGFCTAPYVSLLPVYIEADLGRVPLFTAYLRSLTLALGGAFALVGGRHCDLFGLKATLLAGLAGSIFTGLVFQTTSFWLLTAVVVVIGMAAGHWSAAGQSYLIAAAGTRRLGLGGALYFLSLTLGNAVGSLATGVVKDEWSFPHLGAAMVGSMAAVFVLAAVLLPGETRPAAGGPGGLALWSSYRPLLHRCEVRLLVALRLTITSFWGMASLLLPLLVYRVSGSPAVAAYYGAVSLAVASGCQLLTGALRDRYGRFWPLAAAGVGYAVSAACAALFGHSLTALFAFGTSLTGTAWAISTLIPSLIDEVSGPGERSRLVGLLHTIWSAAMVLGSLVGGCLVEIDARLPFLLGALLAAGGTACGVGLCRRLDRADGAA